MKTKTKTVFLLLFTFMLGTITGAVFQGFFIRQRIEKYSRHMQSPEGFIHRFEKIIEPTDNQKKEIRTILKKHHKEMMRFKREFPTRIDSLQKELESVLTEEQKEKLKNQNCFQNKREHPHGRGHKRRFMNTKSDSTPPPPSPMSLDGE